MKGVRDNQSGQSSRIESKKIKFIVLSTLQMTNDLNLLKTARDEASSTDLVLEGAPPHMLTPNRQATVPDMG